VDQATATVQLRLGTAKHLDLVPDSLQPADYPVRQCLGQTFTGIIYG
jgi:hypothetical protein